MVEQGTENLRVGGSIPSPAILAALLPLLLATQCGDKCEDLCQQTGTLLQAECKPDALTWEDLGARSRNDFVTSCRRQWERERLQLSASDLSVALEFCDDARDALDSLSCEEVLALYAPTP